MIFSSIVILSLCYGVTPQRSTKRTRGTWLIERNFTAARQYITNYYVKDSTLLRPKIPQDYIVIPGLAAYKFYEELVTWNIAKQRCVKDKAHLAVIRSSYERDYFKLLLRVRGYDRLWLGASIPDKRAFIWITVTDELFGSVRYAHWAPREPDYTQDPFPQDICMVMGIDGLGDTSCDEILPYVCKIDLRSN